MGRWNHSRLPRRRSFVSTRWHAHAEGLRFEPLEPRWMMAVDSGQINYSSTVDYDGVLPALNGTGEIHGTKWSDLNGNGDRDEGEPGLAGVTIYLDDDNDGQLDPGEQSTITRADNVDTDPNEAGTYAFTGLMPGTYHVREIVPTGYEQTFPLLKASQFNLEVVFPDDSLSPAQQAVFVQAAARWQEIIIGDIPDVMIAGLGLVDDIVIEATGPFIDGPGGILGQAGPDVLRTGSFLPATGVMEFDAADIVDLVAEGQFEEVILHEMGHVLGIGSIWQDLDLLTGFLTPDPRFIGVQATAEYNAIFGVTETGVPVEADFGPGTAFGHWDEDTFENELMTGFLDGGIPNPISRITVGQMADLGYEVNLNAADDYTEPNLRAPRASLNGPSDRRIEILNLPRTYVDPLAAVTTAGLALAEPDEMFWLVELADAEIVMGVDFGNMPLPGSISGRKWNDRDGDGVQDPNEPGLANWTIFLDGDGDGQLDGGTGTFESEDVPGPIADFETTLSTLELELAGEILDIDVTLNISHTYTADLTVTLISPGGTRVTLAANDGGSGNNYDDTTFDDEASIGVGAGNAPFSGSYRPRTPLSTLDGEEAQGQWTLEVRDDLLFDEGSLNSWSITIQTGEPSTLTDADGNYSFDDLPAGEYVVGEVQQPGWLQVFPASGLHTVVLAPGQNLENVNFGNRNGFIGGRLWNDYDGDGGQDEGEPPLAGWTLYLDQNKNGAFDDGATAFASADVPKQILDLTTVTSQIDIAGLGLITDLDVRVNIQHEFDADLDVFLLSPSGTRVELFTDVGVFADNFNNTGFDDESTTDIADGSAPFVGSYRPEGLLSALDGEDPNGAWTLEVSDDAESDVGMLLGWSLSISTRERTTQSDADGLYGFVDLAAGDYSIAEIVPPGWNRTAPSAPGRYDITLAVAQSVLDADFGNRAGTISGQKWNDLDRDGVRDGNEPGLADWVVFVDQNGNGAFDNGPITFTATDGERVIPDLGATTAALTIGNNLPIEDVNVTLSITHGFIADLDVFLRSPSGTRVELFTDLGGVGRDFTATTLDDEAPGSILVGTGPFTGSYRPEGLLSNFDGENPQGIWTLELADDAGNDVGTLKGWSITIVTREQFATTDSAGRYALHDLLAGSYSVREVAKPGWEGTFPGAAIGHAITLASSEQRTGVDFGAFAANLFGDYQRDGDVDGNDFLLWQRTMGSPAVPPGSGADGDNNGFVAAADLPVWKSNFGGALPAAAPGAVAPEEETSLSALESAFAVLDASALAGPLAYSASILPRTNDLRTAFRPIARWEIVSIPHAVAANSATPQERASFREASSTLSAAVEALELAPALDDDVASAFDEL